MNEFDCRRIVYSSSATVYGTPPTIPIPETTRLQADSPYGKTKIMGETIIEDLCACASPPLSERWFVADNRDHFSADNRWRALSLRYFK